MGVWGCGGQRRPARSHTPIRPYAQTFFWVLALLLLLLWAGTAQAVQRFPRPQFESGHVLPLTTTPVPRAPALAYLDLAVLTGALALASWLVLRRRTRTGVWLLTLFSVAYFGFWRKGCICPVGSTQNVTLALFGAGYTIPWTVLAFFLLPLFTALFFGRTFCAAVCPLGAVQDLFVVRPVRVPPRLAAVLGVLPWVYLGAALLLAATGATFLICRFDPFVGFFRVGANVNLLVWGVALLGLGMIVARPYCRFLCPYGALLSLAARLAWKHATITPTTCIRCRLCEDTCPFGSIRAPTPERAPEPPAAARRRLAGLLALLPVLVLVGGWAGASVSRPLTRLHPTVRTAERVWLEDTRAVTGTTVESQTFRGTGQTTASLLADALALRDRFRRGGWILGGLGGGLLGAALIGLALRRPRTDYTIDQATCLSCARCFAYCPKDREWRGEKPESV